MIPRATLALTAAAHARLLAHLFPGDGKEAAAVLICTRVPGPRLRILVRDIIEVPHEACTTRTDRQLAWPGSYVEQAIDVAERDRHGILLLHSHPGGYAAFSDADDESDRSIMSCIFAAFEGLHGSAVMLPNGCIFARLYDQHGSHTPVDLVSVAGDDISYWWRDDLLNAARRPMAFTSDMTSELSRLTACIIGVSGTGSPAAEQVCRLGFGRVIGIDFDRMEHKNLNRILNTTLADAVAGRSKVSTFSDRANQYREVPYFEGVDANVMTPEAVLAAAQADIIFCCVDSLRGRMVADRIAAAFLLPLIDIGVVIPTRKTKDGVAIAEVCGRIDYVFPGGSSLRDRGVYTPETLLAESLAEVAPAAHAEQVKAGYIHGLPEQAPSVIALNMRASSAGVLEFIARAYPYRHEPNGLYARTDFMLAENIQEFTAEDTFKAKPTPLLASGAAQPLLGLPALGAEGA